MEKVSFDHAGVFIYSDANDLPSHRLKHHVSRKVARRRHNELMELQMNISLNRNRRRKGDTYEVLIERQMDKGLYAGRAWFQAPEVDGVTYVRSKQLAVGEFTSVQITDAYEYDLKGTAV
jgi:ribosomal protein S12 methylthiotransferase